MGVRIMSEHLDAGWSNSEPVLPSRFADTLRERLAGPNVCTPAANDDSISLVADAYKTGLMVGGAQGMSEGYVVGWRWGAVCGAVGTVLIGAAVFLTGVAGFVP